MTESEGSTSVDFVSPSKFKEYYIDGIDDKFTTGFGSPLFGSHSLHLSHDRTSRNNSDRKISSSSRINFNSGLPFTTSPFHDKETAYKIEKKYKRAINFIAQNKNNLKAFRKHTSVANKSGGNFTTNRGKSVNAAMSSAKKRRRQSEAVNNLLLGLSTITSNPILIKSCSATPVKGLVTHTPSKAVSFSTQKPSSTKTSSPSPQTKYSFANAKLNLSASSPYTLVRTPASLKTRGTSTPSTGGKSLSSSRINTPITSNKSSSKNDNMIIGTTPLELSRSPLFSMKRTPSSSSSHRPKTAPLSRQSVGSKHNSSIKNSSAAKATRSPFSLTRLSMSTEKLKITPLPSNRHSMTSVHKSFESSSQVKSGTKKSASVGSPALRRSPFSVHRTLMSTERPRILSSSSLERLRHSISASGNAQRSALEGVSPVSGVSGGRLTRAKAEYPLEVSPEIKEFATTLSNSSSKDSEGKLPDFDIASGIEGLDLAAMNSDEIDAVASSIDTYLSRAEMNDETAAEAEKIDEVDNDANTRHVPIDDSEAACEEGAPLGMLLPHDEVTKSEIECSDNGYSENKSDRSLPVTPTSQKVASMKGMTSSSSKKTDKGSGSRENLRRSFSGGRLSPVPLTIPANTLTSKKSPTNGTNPAAPSSSVTTRRSSRLSLSTTSRIGSDAFVIEEAASHSETAVKKAVKTPKSGKKNRRKTVGKSAAAEADDEDINSLINDARNMILNAEKVVKNIG